MDLKWDIEIVFNDIPKWDIAIIFNDIDFGLQKVKIQEILTNQICVEVFKDEA